MRKAVALAFLCVVVAVGASLVTEAKKEQEQEQKDDAPKAHGEEVPAEDTIEEERRRLKIFAYSTTTSIKRLATTTITAISTCLSISGGSPICTGRRKRSYFSDLVNLDELSESDSLYGSQLEDEDMETVKKEEETADEGGQDEKEGREGEKKRVVKGEKKGKKLTIISSLISTLTLTSTSYLAGTTVTATAFCNAPGLTAGCFGK